MFTAYNNQIKLTTSKSGILTGLSKLMPQTSHWLEGGSGGVWRSKLQTDINEHFSGCRAPEMSHYRPRGRELFVWERKEREREREREREIEAEQRGVYGQILRNMWILPW